MTFFSRLTLAEVSKLKTKVLGKKYSPNMVELNKELKFAAKPEAGRMDAQDSSVN